LISIITHYFILVLYFFGETKRSEIYNGSIDSKHDNHDPEISLTVSISLSVPLVYLQKFLSFSNKFTYCRCS